MERTIQIEKIQEGMTGEEVSNLIDRNFQNVLNNVIQAVDSELSETSENPLQNKIVTSELNKLNEAVFPLTVSVSGGGLYEKGTPITLTINWVSKKGNDVITPDNTTLNGEVVTGTSKQFNSVSSTTTYTVIITKDGKTAQDSTTATFIEPMYFGFDINSNFNNLDIKSLVKQQLRTEPYGSYTLVNDTSGKYLWLCVPNSMTINRVTSSGFDIPMEEYASKTIDIGTYKCYRSSNQINKNTLNIIIY